MKVSKTKANVKKVEKFLDNAGCKQKYKGYKYLKDIIFIYLNVEDYCSLKITEVYREVASEDEYTNSLSAERNIRTVIEAAKNQHTELYKELFGDELVQNLDFVLASVIYLKNNVFSYIDKNTDKEILIDEDLLRSIIRQEIVRSEESIRKIIRDELKNYVLYKNLDLK